MRWALLLLVACTEVTDDGTPWEDAASLASVELGPPPAFDAAPHCKLRVASWNLHLFRDPADLFAHLDASKQIAAADVILLQETSQVEGESLSRTAQLANHLAMTWAHSPVRLFGDGVMQSNGIISRYPLENVAIKRLPHIEQPYQTQERFAIAADVVVGDYRVRVVSIHLEVRVQITDRIRQLDPAVSSLDERAVIGGDFNTAPWQWADALVPLTSTEAVVGMRQAAVLDDYMASRRFTGAIGVETNTFTLPGFGMRLDNLYARGVAIRNAGIEHVRGSDHWPIWFEVDICK